MTGEVLLLLGLLGAAVVLFASDWIAPELTAVLLLLAMVELTPAALPAPFSAWSTCSPSDGACSPRESAR